MYRINLVDELEWLNSLLYCPYAGNYYYIHVKCGPYREVGLDVYDCVQALFQKNLVTAYQQLMKKNLKKLKSQFGENSSNMTSPQGS